MLHTTVVQILVNREPLQRDTHNLDDRLLWLKKKTTKKKYKNYRFKKNIYQKLMSTHRWARIDTHLSKYIFIFVVSHTHTNTNIIFN